VRAPAQRAQDPHRVLQDWARRGSYEHERFDFLGYTFRPRLSRSKSGGQFVNFLPAVSDDARKRIGREIRRWRLHRWSGKTLTDLARSINVIVQGWNNYYGRFYRSQLVRLLKRINEYLVEQSPTVLEGAAARRDESLEGEPTRLDVSVAVPATEIAHVVCQREHRVPLPGRLLQERTKAR
jgi:hypothetical protein